MLQLPAEIIHIVCEYDIESVPSLSQTCSHLRNAILRYDRLWKELCEPLFRAYPRIARPVDQSYYHFYWQQKSIERKVTLQLETARQVENYGSILVSLAEMGPRTEPALKKHARLFENTQSFEGMAEAYCADITLTTVRRRAAIEHINAISRTDEHDVVDLLLTLNTLCSESSEDVVDLESILGKVQYPYHTHTAQQEAIALVDEVRKVIQNSSSGVSTGSNGRVNGVVNLRRLYSFMLVCAYYQLARQHGFTVSTRMFKASMKWHGVFDMSRGSEQGFVLVVTDKAEVWTKEQLDNYFATHPVSWANLADVACEAAFSMFHFSLGARAALISTASIAKIFQTNGQFMHFKSPTSLQLEGNHDEVIQLDNGELTALDQAKAFLPLLSNKYINPGYVSDDDGWFGRVIRDERLAGKRYAVVWHRQGSDDDHMYTVLNSHHKYERLYHRHTAAANPTASELWTQFRSDGIRRLGRAFSGYDQQRGVFVPRTNFSVISSMAASSSCVY